MTVYKMIWTTLCVTLLMATVGIIVLEALGVIVAKEVSLAVAGQWGAMLAVAYHMDRKGGIDP